MNDNKVNDFLYSDNPVHGIPDYGLSETVVRPTKVLANKLRCSICVPISEADLSTSTSIAWREIILLTLGLWPGGMPTFNSGTT